MDELTAEAARADAAYDAAADRFVAALRAYQADQGPYADVDATWQEAEATFNRLLAVDRAQQQAQAAARRQFWRREAA